MNKEPDFQQMCGLMETISQQIGGGNIKPNFVSSGTVSLEIVTTTDEEQSNVRDTINTLLPQLGFEPLRETGVSSDSSNVMLSNPQLGMIFLASEIFESRKFLLSVVKMPLAS